MPCHLDRHPELIVHMALLTLALIAVPLATEAQVGTVYKIGYLIYGSPASVAHRTEALRDAGALTRRDIRG
jgi:hypothetical protein